MMKFFTTHIFLLLTVALFAQETELVKNNPMTNFELGKAVDISEDGNYAIAGSPGIGTSTGRATIYTLMGNNWVKTAELTADDGGGGDEFGSSVSISQSGIYAAIGAPLEDEDGNNSGAVYIFYFDGNGWIQQAKLKASDQANGDLFGNAVSISDDGNYVVVGAKKKDKSSSKYDSGAAYIFKRIADTLEQQVKLDPIDLRFEDEFGTAVSIDRTGENVIVSSPFDNDKGAHSGTVYAFKRTANTWTNTAKLNASNPTISAHFGAAISLNADGTHAAIGAPNANGTAGLAYVFFRTGDYWTEMEIINPDNPNPNQKFGHAVGLSQNGNWLVIGAPGDNTSATSAGAVYVFKGVTNDCLWIQHCKKTATYPGENNEFGHAVAISDSGERVIVGSPFADDYGSNSGAVYTFNIINEICSEPVFISNGANLGNGVDVSADGNYCLVGAPHMIQNNLSSGLVYVYRNNGGVWVEEAQLLSNDISAGDEFGWAVSVNADGSQCVIGAPKANSRGVRSGAAYVFNRTGANWSETAKLIPVATRANDLFGVAVDISENAERAVIGAPGTNQYKGVAYVFGAHDSNWSRSRIFARIDDEPGDQFGVSVSINANGTDAMAGAPYAGTAGRVYAYSTTGYQWEQYDVLSPATSEGTDLAYGAAIDLNDAGDMVLIGAPGVHSNQIGAAYIFDVSISNWTQTHKIEPNDGAAADAFGASVAIANNETYLAIGAPGNDEGATNGGATYIYEATGGTWQESNKIIASDITAGDAFGTDIGLNGDADQIVIGSPLHDHTGINNGAAYKYQCFENAILPIELLDFQVLGIKSQVQINWAWTPTNHIEQFRLQRSTNNLDFKTIATLLVKEGQSTYTFNDKNIATQQRYYYRLEMVEMDGRSTFSTIKTIRLSDENVISFYPNPVQKELYITYPFDKNYHFEIWSMTGELLMQKNQQTILNVEGLMPGAYVLKIKNRRGKMLESYPFLKY